MTKYSPSYLSYELLSILMSSAKTIFIPKNDRKCLKIIVLKFSKCIRGDDVSSIIKTKEIFDINLFGFLVLSLRVTSSLTINRWTTGISWRKTLLWKKRIETYIRLIESSKLSCLIVCRFFFFFLFISHFPFVLYSKWFIDQGFI